MRPTLSRFSCVERTAVDNLAFVPLLVSNFLDDFVDRRSLLRTWDCQLVGGRRNHGDAFGFWVDGDVVPGSGLQKGSRIFTYRRRGKEPVEAFQKKRKHVKQSAYSFTACMNRSSRCSTSFFV